MPEKKAADRARRAKKRGKSPSSQAGEFVKEEIRKVRKGKHGVRSAKQAIAIGLSEARRAGVKLKPPKKGKTPEKTRRSAERAYARKPGASARRKPSKKRAASAVKALKREKKSSVSPRAMSKQGREAAARRSAKERSAAARQAAKTKGAAGRSAAARKAARARSGG